MRGMKLFASMANNKNVEKAIRLTDVLLREAGEIVKEREADRLLKRIGQADGLQSQAKQQFENGSYEQALKLTLRAREILKDALNATKADLSREDVEPTLRGTDKLLARMKEPISRSGDELAADLFDRAHAKQDKAWQELRQNKLRAALAYTRLARKLANRAFRQITNEGG
jgi:hypothetical protein